MNYLKTLSYSCFFGILSFLLTVLLSIYYNPWFNFFKHAFSDLGSLSANMPWIYNYGLIVTSIFVLLYSVYIIAISKNKLETISGAFFFISGIFLALIGIFYAETRPHTFVSTYFFIQSDFSIIAWSLGVIKRKITLGFFMLFIALISPMFAILLPWPSVAIQEAFGITIIILWVIIVFLTYRKEV